MNESNEWKARIAAAFKPVQTYKATVCSSPQPETEAMSYFVDTLTKLGVIEALIGVEGLSDESKLKFGDFREAFKELPITVLRMSWAGLCGGKKEGSAAAGGAGDTDERTAQLKALGFKIKLEDASVTLLLPLYRPDLPADAVTVALKKRFSDKPVVAFNEDGTVAVTQTVQYISDLEQGFPARETIMVNNQLAKLWPVGVKPSTLVDEDPLFPGQPLGNGYSLVNNRNWSGISHEQRQLCRIITTRGDIDPENKEAVLRLLERALGGKLAETYPEAALEFRELKQRDELPKLKVVLGAGAAKPNNPFGVRRTY